MPEQDESLFLEIDSELKEALAKLRERRRSVDELINQQQQPAVEAEAAQAPVETNPEQVEQGHDTP